MAYRPPRLFPLLMLGCVALLVLSRLQTSGTQSGAVSEEQSDSRSLPTQVPVDGRGQSGQGLPSGAPTDTRFGLESRFARVRRVVDGDTLLLENGERVRLFGVDTPETKIPNQPPEPYGPEATEFTTQFVTGQTVRLEFDAERFDKYGRTLAYVYVGERMLNEELILAGLSPAQLQYPFRNDMKRRFAAAEQVARSRGVGLWSGMNPRMDVRPGARLDQELGSESPAGASQRLPPNL